MANYFLKHILSIIYTFILYLLGFKTYTSLVQSVCNELSKINIFYVKFFQWFAFSINNGSENKELYYFFNTFKENVYYSKNDIDNNALQILVDELKLDNKTIEFESLEPVNAGSIALVFKANIDGKPHAIKVLRKNIHVELQNIFKQFDFIINIISFLPYINVINLKSLFNDNKLLLNEQLDFCREVNNITLFADTFKNNSHIVIPKVYKKYTDNNPNIIVMEYLEGIKINDLDKEDTIEFSTIISRFVLNSYFFKNLYHGDLHTGNIIFMKNDHDKPKYKLGIIDFGLIGFLDVEQQNLIVDILICFVKKENKRIVNCILNYHIMEEKKKSIELNKEILDKMYKEFEFLIETKQMLNNDDVTHYDFYLIFKIFKKYDLVIPKGLNNYLYATLSMLDTLRELGRFEKPYGILEGIFSELKIL
jgi:predicted unusual protein kinase regulating ubiquinone biosynthesis (AarF/ABC1/UbiB family)